MKVTLRVCLALMCFNDKNQKRRSLAIYNLDVYLVKLKKNVKKQAQI
ncbi:hypothetical protein [Campylobacter geochelonis]|nr:hypothetical protein [Campylobacter geochelonis]